MARRRWRPSERERSYDVTTRRPGGVRARGGGEVGGGRLSLCAGGGGRWMMARVRELRMAREGGG